MKKDWEGGRKTFKKNRCDNIVAFSVPRTAYGATHGKVRARMMLRHTWVSRRSHGSVLALNSRVVHDHIDIRCWQGVLLWQEIGCKSKGYKLYEPELATRAYTHIFCLLARKRFRRRDNLGCPSQSRDSTDAFYASTHGSHSVRTSIVRMYNISISTYCCFAVALSVPRAALAGHIFTATKRLQKQGLKTIGTKPCNASIHTYIQPAHMDLILLAQTC